jgi:hypothetical protein
MTAGLGDRSADVVAYVLDHPDGVSPADVAAALELDPAAVRVYLGRAVRTGRLHKPTRGRYTPVASVANVTSGEILPPEGNSSNGRNSPSGPASDDSGR